MYRESYGILKNGSYTRYLYSATGEILGRVDVSDDNGDSVAYSSIGEVVGYLRNGFTFDKSGTLLAQSDILSSLLVIERRV